MCFQFLFSKNEVTGSEVDKGGGARFVPGTKKGLNENVKRETKKIFRGGKRILMWNKFVKKNNCREDRQVLL